jgi:hypothetical protein
VAVKRAVAERRFRPLVVRRSRREAWRTRRQPPRADGILVASGDLGGQLPEEIPRVQKRIIGNATPRTNRVPRRRSRIHDRHPHPTQPSSPTSHTPFSTARRRHAFRGAREAGTRGGVRVMDASSVPSRFPEFRERRKSISELRSRSIDIPHSTAKAAYSGLGDKRAPSSPNASGTPPGSALYPAPNRSS